MTNTGLWNVYTAARSHEVTEETEMRAFKAAVGVFGALMLISLDFSTPTAYAARGTDTGQDKAATVDQTGSCGAPGHPPCPLQGWMRTNVAGPLAANDSALLAAGLEKTAKLAPDPAWSSWAFIAANGATAAKRGDIAAVRASCKSCHDSWRELYKSKYRMRPIPR